MSEEIVSQRLKRICDGCGAEKEWEIANPSDSTIMEMHEWYTIVRVLPIEGRYAKVAVQACRAACLESAGNKLNSWKFSDPDDNINLANLQVSGLN
jgi:hypothetical protein